MLHWFPTPYPDELFYSVFARYHVRSGNTSPKITTEELFGTRSVRSVWDLPANLKALLTRIDSNWKVEDVLNNHTMYSYYASFLLPEQAKKVYDAMSSNKGSTIHTRIGIAASNVKPKVNLWVCSNCIQDDMDQYGETYWHRIHQAPGVFICPKHETVLEETNVSVKAENQHEYMIAEPDVERSIVDIGDLENAEFQQLLKIAEATKTVLEGTHRQTDNNTVRNKYLALLKQKELASVGGFLRREKVYSNFCSLFSGRLLSLLQSPISFEEANWLTMIFQKHRKSFHPLRHILIMLFLETTMDHLFEQEEYHPFGPGPWVCLNPACSKYHESVVNSLVITSCYDTKRPVGTFRCDHCGFTFSRRGPDQCPNDEYQIGTIKEYGSVWKDKLTLLVGEGNLLKDIAHQLQASTDTVRKYAAELGLKVNWKTPRNKRTKSKVRIEEHLSLLKRRKEEWLTLTHQYPAKSKTNLRKIRPEVYAFIYKYDRDWLHSHSPVKKTVQPPNKRVNWEERDRQLLKAVKDEVHNWDANADKLTRLTVTSIGRKINKLSLFQKKAEKLPHTIDYLSSVVEDISSFQKRRIEKTVQKMKADGERILEWEVYRKAGLRSNVSSDVKRLIAMRATEYYS